MSPLVVSDSWFLLRPWYEGLEDVALREGSKFSEESA